MDRERDELDRYLDGLLSAEEAERFERRLERSPELAAEAAAQARVDAFLERRFAPPRDLAARQRPSGRSRAIADGAGSAGHPSDQGPGRRGWLAAAAAVLVGLALGFALRGDGAPGPEPRGASLETAAAPALPGGPAGLEPRTAAETHGLTPRSAPDLAALYARLSEAPVVSGAPGPWGELVALPELGGNAAGGSLESRLAARYDECLDLSTPACIVLGPYAAPEWPSATVLVGFCDGGAPTLLVVDDQTMAGCGLVPRTGTLSPFYKEVSGLAVWEVTEGDHPVLLDGVRSCAD